MMTTRTQILPPRYRDVVRISTGGMGDIYLAVDDELGRDVVVKTMSEAYAQDESLRLRFKREALAAARLSGTRNVVTIFDVGEYDSRPFIVMEYLRGGSLQERAGSGPCAQGRVLDWLEEAANALDSAHRVGVVHRDVKPGNLLLDEHGHVHVADFGIASAAGLDSFTQTGTILGTAGYLAPEQAQGRRAEAASDRYALAVVAFELLTGRRPFARETPTAEAAAHVNAAVPSARGLNASLPPEVDDVFERALAKDPAARYATAAEFVAELRHTLHEAAGATQVVAPTARVVADRARRRWWIPVLAALLLAAGVAAAVAATRDSGGNDAAPTKPPTVVKTVTAPGTTVERTVTTAPAQPQPSSPSGSVLNDQGYTKMRAGDYAGALPLLEQAVQKLRGSGALTEAYADYNLAYTRFALGRCDGVVDLLNGSESIQGHRKEIDHLRKRAEHTCEGGASRGNGDEG
jgi:tRNA A-37 threonylcarbamoyl transferase component Bud32